VQIDTNKRDVAVAVTECGQQLIGRDASTHNAKCMATTRGPGADGIQRHALARLFPYGDHDPYIAS
jgi:hypothetical protein